MFTADNSEFNQGDRNILNAALGRLMADVDGDDDHMAQVEKSYSDLLNNAYVDGCTEDDLVRSVLAR